MYALVFLFFIVWIPAFAGMTFFYPILNLSQREGLLAIGIIQFVLVVIIFHS